MVSRSRIVSYLNFRDVNNRLSECQVQRARQLRLLSSSLISLATALLQNLTPTLFLAFQITSLQYVLITIIKNACKHRYITGEVMAGNTIGQLFRVTTFGESHGVALGCIIDGCPPGLALTEADMQHDLDRRRPGTSKYTTQRREADEVKILSGVFEGQTTGTSIGLLIENTDQRSKDYSNIQDLFRPVTLITLTIKSMGYVITVVVVVHLHVKLPCVLPQVLWLRNTSNKFMASKYVLTYHKWVRLKLIKLIGNKSNKMPFSAQMLIKSMLLMS